MDDRLSDLKSNKHIHHFMISIVISHANFFSLSVDHWVEGWLTGRFSFLI